MFKAKWNGVELACGSDVIEVEERLYFRPEDVRQDFLRPAADRSICEWKGGEAEYFDIIAAGGINRAAAWRYANLGAHAAPLAGRFAFWRGVEAAWDGAGEAPDLRRITPLPPNVAKALGASDVVWRPSPLPPFAGSAEAERFEGYLIRSLRVLVDVLATPPESEKRAVIAGAESRAQKIVTWNLAFPADAYGYVAVWGSAPPDRQTIDVLRRRGVVIALAQPVIVLSAGTEAAGGAC